MRAIPFALLTLLACAPAARAEPVYELTGALTALGVQVLALDEGDLNGGLVRPLGGIVSAVLTVNGVSLPTFPRVFGDLFFTLRATDFTVLPDRTVYTFENVITGSVAGTQWRLTGLTGTVLPASPNGLLLAGTIPATPGGLPPGGAFDLSPFLGGGAVEARVFAAGFDWDRAFAEGGFSVAGFRADFTLRAAAAVPEPHGWTLLATAAGLLGYAACRRKWTRPPSGSPCRVPPRTVTGPEVNDPCGAWGPCHEKWYSPSDTTKSHRHPPATGAVRTTAASYDPAGRVASTANSRHDRAGFECGSCEVADSATRDARAPVASRAYMHTRPGTSIGSTIGLPNTSTVFHTA